MRMPTPPSSAARVKKLRTSDDASAATATGRGKRSLTRSKLALPATAATRPDISAKTMMPRTPTGTAHSSR